MINKNMNTYPQVSMTYPHRKYCLCLTCRFALERSAFPPVVFVRRAERRELNDAQRKIVAKVKLENWNDWAKG